jgi:TRAP-type uncharacterized transport system substrate-binding protein
MYRHRKELLQVSAVARDMTIENIYQLPAVPLHPGTQLYMENPAQECSQ